MLSLDKSKTCVGYFSASERRALRTKHLKHASGQRHTLMVLLTLFQYYYCGCYGAGIRMVKTLEQCVMVPVEVLPE
jgi:hypothetical protein